MKILKFFTFLCLFLFTNYSLQAQSDVRIKQKATRIHKRLFTVDSHTDTPLNFLDKSYNIATNNSAGHTCVDFPRMKKGGLDAAFFAVFTSQGPRTPEGNAKVKAKAVAIFDSIENAVNRNKQISGIATTPKQAHKLVRQGKSVVFIGVENGYPIGNDLEMVSYFYSRGARYITLCHTKNNDICSSSTDTNNQTGLSDFGRKVVQNMNKLGMMVDVSHISDQSFFDVINLSKAPVIASHSCARALCDNPRNLTDDMLKALAANGGVIQMCILSDYVKTPPPNPARDSAHAAVRAKYRNFQDLSDAEWQAAGRDWYGIDDVFPQKLATVSDVADHIDHIVKIAGINHIGIGTDFDGGGEVDGCRDCCELPNITLELVKRGYTKSQLKKIWGGNLMRVMKQTHKMGKKL